MRRGVGDDLMSGCEETAYDQIFTTRGIFIKTFSTFYTEITGRDHIDQQGAGGVFGVAKAFVKNAEDIEADVQTDEVGQLRGPHGVGHSQFHNSIYLLYTGYA